MHSVFETLRKMAKSFGWIVLSSTLILSISCTKKKVSDTDDTIYEIVEQNVKGMDPVYTSDVYTSKAVSQIYETLLEYHHLKRPLVLQPLLAVEMPAASEDGLTHTFKIKPGARFQDDPAFPNGKGREVTATDFIYSWKRLADPANRSDGFWIFDGRIKGLNEWRAAMEKGKANYDTPIEGLVAKDDKTLVVKLTKPYFQLYYVLAHNYSAVVPREAVEKYGKEFLNHPVGTGPYQLENWVRGSKIVMKANPTWHGQTYPTDGDPGDEEKGLLKDAGKALPFAKKLVFYEVTEDQPRWLKFMKGEVDLSTIPKDNFDSAITNGATSAELAKKGIQLLVIKEPDVTYTAFNMADKSIAENINLRRAMSLAIDTDTMIKKFYNGRAISAQSPIPPDVDAYDPDYKNPYKGFDVGKAKEFMKKAGYKEGEGPTIEYSTVSNSTSRQMAEYIQQSMAAIGVKLKVLSTDWPQFMNKIREKKAQVWGVAWLADYPDAENFLQLLYGKNISPGPNGANYVNPEYDSLYEKAALLPPGKERTEIYHKMRDILIKDSPWIPGVHRLGYYLHYSWLHNFKRHSIISNYHKYLRVNPKARAEMKVKL
ncbi:MAG: ABC transporter substrate-binding protein [Bdellovibrionales bacterium]|nr:ABC transporter substrate-binding protein [Bdellovibrionales bacterium]